MSVPRTDVATLTQWLIDARVALQLLMTGRAVVEIIADGYTTKFRAADADKLRSYISLLEQQIAGHAAPSGIGIMF